MIQNCQDYEVLKLSFQQFMKLSSSQRDMSGSILGDLSNHRWSRGVNQGPQNTFKTGLQELDKDERRMTQMIEVYMLFSFIPILLLL